jgi:hypothetical protein
MSGELQLYFPCFRSSVFPRFELEIRITETRKNGIAEKDQTAGSHFAARNGVASVGTLLSNPLAPKMTEGADVAL